MTMRPSRAASYPLRPVCATRKPRPAPTRFESAAPRSVVSTPSAFGAATLAALAVCIPSLSAAQEVDAAGMQAFEGYLSENAMQLLYGRDMDVGEFGRNQVRGGFFINEDRDLIGIADMMIDVGEPQRRPYWSLQAGARAYGALMAVENQDVFSIGLGGTLSYFLGRNRATSLSVTAFYAPDIVTFGNADNIKDVAVRFETRLSETTRLFVGYRTFEFDLEIDREVDDNMHVGIRHEF